MSSKISHVEDHTWQIKEERPGGRQENEAGRDVRIKQGSSESC